MKLPEIFESVELTPGTVKYKREMVGRHNGKKALVKTDLKTHYAAGIINVKKEDTERFYLKIGDGQKRREEQFYYRYLEELLVEK